MSDYGYDALSKHPNAQMDVEQVDDDNGLIMDEGYDGCYYGCLVDGSDDGYYCYNDVK